MGTDAAPHGLAKHARTLGAFALGLTVCSGALAPALFPVKSYELWCALRYGGAVPGAQGLLLTIREAPPGLCGPGRGPWVELEFRNVGSAPLLLHYPEVLGEELSFRVLDPESLPPEALATALDRAILASWVHQAQLAPGQRIGFSCDLSRWLRFPKVGIYTLRAERVAFGVPDGGLPCRSNPLQVLVNQSQVMRKDRDAPADKEGNRR